MLCLFLQRLKIEFLREELENLGAGVDRESEGVDIADTAAAAALAEAEAEAEAEVLIEEGEGGEVGGVGTNTHNMICCINNPYGDAEQVPD